MQIFYLTKDKMLQLFLKKVLKNKGHKVYATSNIEELFVIKDIEAQFIFVDEEFLSELPSTFFGPMRKYILISSKAQNLPPFTKILQKPFGIKELEAVLL